MKILFTTSDHWFSALIRWVTKEPVSHCALSVDDAVIHSNLLGPHVDTLESFTKKVDILYELDFPTNYVKVFDMLAVSRFAWYDWGAMLYLGLRSIFPFLPKANLWRSSGMFLCTEWVTEYLEDEEDATITPFRLYLLLRDSLSQKKPA